MLHLGIFKFGKIISVIKIEGLY